MLVKRVSVENVRSFLERADLIMDGQISILIGPNGGGKTNLLDVVMIALRRHLFASLYAAHAPTPENLNRHEIRANDSLNNMVLEKHSAGASKSQLVEIEVEITERDIKNMKAMQRDADQLTEIAGKKYYNINLMAPKTWKLDDLSAGARLNYIIRDGALWGEREMSSPQTAFLQYMRFFEIDGMVRDEFGMAPLTTPLIYLTVNRSGSGFQSTIELAGYNAFETKRHSDTAISRSPGSMVNLAIGRLAQKYRLLLEKDRGCAAKDFREDENIAALTNLLGELGYEWSLETVNALKNQYDVRLSKQGSSFSVGAASSGERELLTYLFAIFALNVRDALIIVDEPELHLHPTWQKTLLNLFIRLAGSTGNQFLLATHSPTFVSPESIAFVSRVFSRNQQSHIQRLDAKALPEAKHLLNIVQSQNNERLFFSDEVVLVEGISDRIFFEAVLRRLRTSSSSRTTLEIINVGGKGLFEPYRKLLTACDIKCSIIADLDYLEEVAPPEINELFRVDAREIKEDVIENPKSYDGDALVDGIERALTDGNWNHAKGMWSYIKSRRRKLQKDIDESARKQLDAYITLKRSERIYVLSRGALEAYLPEGHASKDLGRLIHFLNDGNFWDRLPLDGRAEVEDVATSLLQA